MKKKFLLNILKNDFYEKPSLNKIRYFKRKHKLRHNSKIKNKY